MKRSIFRAVIAAIVLAAATGAGSTARANGNHDVAAPSVTGSAPPPRLVAESETFELVGVLENGTTLRLWLDRWTDNAPVRGARIELEIGTTQLVAIPATEAVGYVATLPAPLPEGVHPVTVSIAAGAETDLLAGELDVHAAQAAASAGGDTHRLPLHLDALPRPLVAVIAIAMLAVIAAAMYFRARRARRSLA